ncbi:hypothetical protein EDD85DRAFT_324032 [Armillaria nabsnona]|nr:hypothetical protein EDD85DRAFT_324032 [Armillaria nabsnona]
MTVMLCLSYRYILPVLGALLLYTIPFSHLSTHPACIVIPSRCRNNHLDDKTRTTCTYFVLQNVGKNVYNPVRHLPCPA